MYTALFLLSELIYSYSLYKMLRALSGKCRIGKTGEIVCYLVYGLLTGSIYLLWNIPILTIFANLVFLYLLSMLYEGKMSGRIFYVILILVLLAGAETIAMQLMRELPTEVISENIEYGNIFTVYLGRLVQLVIFEMVVKIIGRKRHKFTAYQLGSFLVISVGSIYLEITLYLEMIREKPVFVTATCIIILLMDVCIIWGYDMLSQEYQKAKKSEMLVLKNEAYQKEIDIMKNQELSIRRMRHDIKNHCIALGELAKQKDNDKILQYLQEMLQEMETKQVWLQTGNIVIDGFVNYKFTQAENHGIHCQAEAKIPRDLPLDEFACAGILGNLLDNAIEAAAQASDPEIRLLLRYDKNVLRLQINNTYQGEIKKQKGELVTQKQDKKRHGYGLNSVKRAVERCHGQIKTEYMEGRFSVFVMLPIMENREK